MINIKKNYGFIGLRGLRKKSVKCYLPDFLVSLFKIL